MLLFLSVQDSNILLDIFELNISGCTKINIKEKEKPNLSCE